MRGRVLIVAGSDSGGGAGIQADIKTVTALGGYAATAITALTAQNTRGVFGVVGVEPDFIRKQMRVVLDDIGTDALKTGMLHTEAVIAAVADVLDELDPTMPVVVDPVMVATSGDVLLDPGAQSALIRRLLPQATVLTPNIPEAERLSGLAIPDVGAMREAAERLRVMGAAAVLLKGGHLPGATVHDVLVDAEGVTVFESPRIETTSTHGTGCTLASAIAAGLAQGLELRHAVARARAYLYEAIRTAPGLGGGHGPVNHVHTVRPFDPTG
ncbi:MAG: bifunctional hydroxymethylpyrimidine kinase/phosphomethylpyrimidine kinase [Alphaproteobacteria bacterium]|nr:MAG: bifunctional hydroxymethylpyrimidine kinase/phosphomethylpyrimidine kinase [Alphaproteobacteria bacterium]